MRHRIERFRPKAVRVTVVEALLGFVKIINTLIHHPIQRAGQHPQIPVVAVIMMPSTNSIPRFLLPQSGAIWRTRFANPSSTSQIARTVRNASTKPLPIKKNSKPLVLEQPPKFNPPSHGSRLPNKKYKKYPGPQLSEEELQTQKTKKYPHMMPAEGTFMHWFLTNTSIHLYITMGTLFTLASFVWITNFNRDSPFADMIPAWPQFFLHPIAYLRTFSEVLKLTNEYETAQIIEKRKRRVEDVEKRAAYRKAHGLDLDEGFGGWTAKTDEQLMGPGIPLGDGSREARLEVAGEGAGEPEEPRRREKRPLKKWLGIW